MDPKMGNAQVKFCPKCNNHCPVDALQCGKGRKYFGKAGVGKGRHNHHDHSRPRDGLSGLLHQCGRFVRHAGLEEDELFQAFTSEEKAALQALLEKLSAGWQDRFGDEIFNRRHGHEGGKDHHKHGGHDK